MDVGELRRWNKLKHKHSGEIITANKIDNGYFSDKISYFCGEDPNPWAVIGGQHSWHGEVNSIPCDLLEPIELTEDILVKKCGFEKSTNSSCDMENIFKNNSITLIQIGKSFYYAECVRSDTAHEWEPIKEIKYLHRLQNMNYEFSDEELDVKL